MNRLKKIDKAESGDKKTSKKNEKKKKKKLQNRYSQSERISAMSDQVKAALVIAISLSLGSNRLAPTRAYFLSR